ncbi:heterokaryon incompatibility protein-domain-containing protein [Sordaria brevicollis]|uniref:Heterokaryon incompatibility protein-domain-containing protein n=1 Tax=Sordaria brevicollis TaxID=83679 RepID=A0AAE0PEA0_SORBR|nr:heterokaryon incompatibility protein-domain-containing protein [Sordaria brevicollis]
MSTPNSCNICCNLRPPYHMYYDGKPYSTTHWTHTPSELITSAKGGCAYCRFVLEAIRYFDPVEFPVNVTSFVSPAGGCNLRVDYTQKGAVGFQVYTPLGTFPFWSGWEIYHEPAWPGITHSAELSPSPDSPEAMKFIRSCLQTCNEHHSNCSTASSQPPTRLIDVCPDGLDSSYVRLIETHSPPSLSPKEFPCIALSYCWGTGKTLTTLTTNYSSLTAGFLSSTLPQTLQDAVVVTRKIGQRYVWIDALCIIQDSASDWEVEASRMASVYRNAWLTVVAATAGGSDEGFLGQAHLSAGENWKMPYRVTWPQPTGQGMKKPEGNKGTILAARLAFTDLEHSHSRTRDKLQRIPNPWATRAWTFQEQLLSKRMLLFTGYELRWICSVANVCECTYLQQHHQQQQEREAGDPLARSIFPLPETKEEVYETWHDVVEEYTNRSLTYQTDRLPAVAGLAKVVSERLEALSNGPAAPAMGKKKKTRYLAGLWQGNLTMDLAWRARFVAPPSQPTTSTPNSGATCTCPSSGAGTAYIAPTFSWASITNPVCCRLSQPGWKPRCVVLDAGCEVVTDANPLGRVKSGFVTLRGHLLKSTLIDPYSGKGDLYYTLPDGWGGEERLKVYPDQLLEEVDVPLSVHQPQGDAASVAVRHRKEQRLAVYFLVLGLSTDDNHQGKFERVGLAIGEVEEIAGAWDLRRITVLTPETSSDIARW